MTRRQVSRIKIIVFFPLGLVTAKVYHLKWPAYPYSKEVLSGHCISVSHIVVY